MFYIHKIHRVPNNVYRHSTVKAEKCKCGLCIMTFFCGYSKEGQGVTLQCRNLTDITAQPGDQGLTIIVVNHVDSMYTWFVMKMALYLYGLPLKNTLTSLTMRKTSHRFQLGNILQNIWPALQNVWGHQKRKVWETVTTKCNLVSWIGCWKGKRHYRKRRKFE